MDYEKLHKDTIAKLQDMVNSGKITVEIACGICADFVPESEDEKIRKFIATAIENLKIIDNEDRNSLCNKALAWLEKQGEHQKFRDSIQVGDKVTRNEDGVLVNLSQLKRVAKPVEPMIVGQEPLYDYTNANICQKDFAEQKLAWSEEDESNLDYLIDFCNGYYNGNKPVLTESTARSLSNWLYRLKSGEIQLKTYSNLGWTGEEDAVLHNACEFIRHRMHSNGNIGGMDYKVLYQKLKSLKERIQPQPKQEWSEENEKMFKHIIAKATLHFSSINYLDEEEINFLKSLRPQSQWKPSDKQMEQLHKYCPDNRPLTQLYQDLKKLMEE